MKNHILGAANRVARASLVQAPVGEVNKTLYQQRSEICSSVQQCIETPTIARWGLPYYRGKRNPAENKVGTMCKGETRLNRFKLLALHHASTFLCVQVCVLGIV